MLLKESAGDVPLSLWVRKRCIPAAQLSAPRGPVIKRNKAPEASTSPVTLADVSKSLGIRLCPHGKETGRFCFDCRGIV